MHSATSFAAVSEAAPATLDAAALQRLRDLDPAGTGRLVERVLRAFESSIARLTPQLQTARSRGDMQAVRHVAHTLKSSSASVGALALSRLCAEIESAVRDQSFAALPDSLDAMESELHAVLQAVRTTLDPT